MSSAYILRASLLSALLLAAFASLFVVLVDRTSVVSAGLSEPGAATARNAVTGHSSVTFQVPAPPPAAATTPTPPDLTVTPIPSSDPGSLLTLWILILMAGGFFGSLVWLRRQRPPKKPPKAS